MEKQQNVFYINIISGYLEKFVVGKMPETVYFSKNMMFIKNEKLYNVEESEFAIDYIEASKRYKLPVKFLGFLWSSMGEKFEMYEEDIAANIKDINKIIKVRFFGEDIHIKIWLYKRGNVDTYLMDCNIEENPIHIRKITAHNHKDISENKIISDAIMGIGGVEVLRTLNIHPKIYHFNGEYCILGIYKMFLNKIKKDNRGREEDIIAKIRSKCVTTIHDMHIKNYSVDVISELFDSKDSGKEFKNKINRSNNVYTNILLNNRKSNATSILHGENIRRRVENDKIKDKLVDIVNGLYIQRYIKKSILTSFKNQKNVLKAHQEQKNKLLNYIYSKTFVKLKQDRIVIGIIATSNEYERWNLILRDKEKLFELLEEDKMQLIFYVQAAKLSSAEINFKKYISIKRKYPKNIIFLNDLDSKLHRRMINGCDLILNASKIPQEPCGIQRIKAAVNGVLNFSTLNGCWPEVCVEGINGWQIGSGVRFKDTKEQDKHDISSLYEILINKVLHVYYDDKKKWEDMIIQSMKSTMEYFCIERIIIEYYDNMYRKSN